MIHSISSFNSRSNAINYLYILLFTISLLMGFTSEVRATHAMGMDLTYIEVGKDSFLVTLAFYRDCGGVAAPNSVTINAKSGSCNKNLNFTFPKIGSGQETTPVCTSLVTQCNGGTFPGSEEYKYQKIIVLPQKCTDWVLSTSICCRNNGITTIQNPGNQNIFVETKLNNFYKNSSPDFSNNPVPFVCANQSYCFNNGAVDPNGDSLVYSLVTPRTNTAAGDTITFKSGYSRKKPITSSPQLTLNPITGDMCMFPTDSTEIGVIAVLVQEYRNGVLIGSIMRDIQMRIIGCPAGNDFPAASGIDSTTNFTLKVCANSNLSFNVYSNDPDSGQVVTMTWNQSIPGATFNISAGPRPVGSFSWTPNNSHIRSQPYCFTVQVADDNCPFNGVQIFSYCIYVVGVQAIVDSLFDPTCFGLCNGRASATLLNGIPPFTYSWNDPSTQSTPTATGLCAGNFVVTGTDSTGCQTYDSVSLFDPLPIILKMDSIAVSCSGGSDGKAILTNVSNGIPPYLLTWEVDAGLQTTDTAVSLKAGIYSVVVTDSNECVATDSVEVVEPLPITPTMTNIANVSCHGNNDGVASVSVSGGIAPYTIEWDSTSGFQTNDTAFNLSAGMRKVIITDIKGCKVIDSILITEPSTAINLSLTAVDVTCNGGSSGSATVVANGGTPPYNYTWDAGTGGQTTATAVNLPAGTYSVVVTDSNNCVAYPNIVISEPQFALTVTAVDSFVKCFGDLNGVAGVEVSGGTAPYAYLWDAAASSQTTQYASGLGSGTYTVQITDSLGCSDSIDVNVYQGGDTLVIAVNHINVTCNNGTDGSAVVSILGGQSPFQIQWDSTAGSQTTDTAFGLPAGTYSVMVTDSFGCSLDSAVVITEPPPLLALTTNHTDVTCFGDSNGSASVVAAGGTPPYLYLWSPNSGGQTTDTAKGLKAGTYYVTVYDSNYCVTSPDIEISEPNQALSAVVSAIDANCFNGSDGKAIVSGTGGSPTFTYQWGASTGFQTNDTASNLAAGMHSVTVTDSLNCTFDTTVQVSQPSSPLQVTFSSTPTLCFGGNSGSAIAFIGGGTAPYSLLWGTSAGSQTNDTVLNLTYGYHVLAITDNNGCGILDSAFVDGPPEPMVPTISSIPVKCNGNEDGLAIVEASGGSAPYTYLWSSNASNQTNDTAFALGAGNYTVTVFDSNLCDTSISVTVTQPPVLNDSVYISSNFNGSAIKCFGEKNGMATAVAFGGVAPYRFLWDSTANNQSNDTAFNLSEGVYSVIITDTNGCTTSGSVSVGSPQKMGFTVVQLRHISCYNGHDGRIEVLGFGGTGSYQYAWTPAQTGTNIADSLTIGSYKVTITDTNFCVHDTTIALMEPTVLNDNIINMDANCFGESSGKAIGIVQGGTPPYTYLWQVSTTNFQINDTAVNLSAGIYPFLAKDAKNCTIRDTAVIGQPPEVFVSVSRNDTICALQPLNIFASGSGGNGGPFTYNWLPFLGSNDSSQIVAPSSTTVYSVAALDNKNCSSDSQLITVFIRDFSQDFLEVVSLGDVCLGDSTGVYATHNGPFGGYNYAWNFGKTTFGPHTVKPDTATYYVFKVQDICLNVLKDSVLVNVFPNPEFDLDSIIAIGCSPLTVTFNDEANNSPNLTYLWEYGDGNGSINKQSTYEFKKAGSYNIILTVTSENGCKSTNKDSPSYVLVHPTPRTLFTGTPIIADMRNPTIQYQNYSSIASGDSIVFYHWEFGDGDTSNLINPPHTFGDTGLYHTTLVAVSSGGCRDEFALDIRIQPYYTLKIPNAFTPGSGGSGGRWISGDLSNHIFYPFTDHPEAVVEYEMLIFNRWGELIFESSDIFTGWDGYYRSKLTAQEVYVYKIKLHWENGQEFEEVGDVTLFK